MNLRDINFVGFQKIKKYHFNNFGGFEFWYLEKFHPKIQNSELLKWSKLQFLGGFKVTKIDFTLNLKVEF